MSEASSHWPFNAALTLASLLMTLPVNAQEAPLASGAGAPDATVPTLPTPTPEPRVPEDLPRLILDTGRPRVPEPEPDTYRFDAHGEYQLRYQAQSSFPLVPTASTAAGRPGLVGDSIGQNQFVSHWLRVTPRLQILDVLELVGQIDVLTGVVAGERAHGTSADATPRDRYNGFDNVQPRWLFAQYNLPFGLFRVGQQPNHWGMGILANDGDHPTLFGDYRYGSISERILFATKPFGRRSDVYVALAGDLVFRDAYATLTHGDTAFQGVLAAFWERGPNRLGLFSLLRHQERDRTSASPYSTYTDGIDAGTIDLHGKFALPLAESESTWLFGEAEAAVILGSTNALRTADQALRDERTSLRSYGGAAVLGVVHRAFSGGDAATARKTSESYLGRADERGVPFGRFVGQLEVGYASGDADPYDGTQKRFTFDPNHRIGLLLFDEVLRFQTARSATAATDPTLSNGQRPTPGVDLLPSNGGVFGAQYINPTFIYRPRHFLDVKGGMVVAQTTADLVDPYRVATSGSYVNYRGGSPKKRDLGVEFDVGVEARFPLGAGPKLVLGAQGGVLFPGGALENDLGVRIPTQWIGIGRVGILF